MKALQKAKMIKQKKFVLYLILLLTVSILTEYSFSNIATANFVFPPSDPIITFESPVNTTYNTNNISLKVEFYTYKTGYYGAPEEESLRQFQYSIDENIFEPLKITNSSIGRNPGTDVFFDGVIDLQQLSEGYHNLTVKAVLDYSDLNYPYKAGNYSETYNFHTESTARAYLIVDVVPEPSSTSTVPEFSWLVILAIPLSIMPLVIMKLLRRNKI